MHHYILYAAAWLFMSGFASQKMQSDNAIEYIVAILLGPAFFPWALGQALHTFLTKK